MLCKTGRGYRPRPVRQKQNQEDSVVVLINRNTRRQLLTAAGAGALAFGMPGRGYAKMPMGQKQAPYFYRFKLGSAECTIVSDGQLPLGDPNASFVNIDKTEIARELTDNFLPLDNAVLEQNVLVVNFGDRVVLFDTGMGSDALFGNGTGKLMATLQQANIDPAGVDAVVMSHAHIDHCGGLIGAGGKRNFPNAQYFIGEADFNYWTDDSKIPPNYPARPHFLAQARNNLLPVKDAVHFYKDNEQILPGVTALSAPGHTVSHTIFMIESGGKQLCYIGDLAHHPVLLLEHPRTQFAYDTDAVQSADSRVRMLTMLAANRIPLLAYHFAWPGVGHVSKQGDGFRYFPTPTQMESVATL
jgi:glyoxylase-like metal-dependent hydrolase (beta-lactamase superfamily II)